MVDRNLLSALITAFRSSSGSFLFPLEWDRADAEFSVMLSPGPQSIIGLPLPPVQITLRSPQTYKPKSIVAAAVLAAVYIFNGSKRATSNLVGNDSMITVEC